MSYVPDDNDDGIPMTPEPYYHKNKKDKIIASEEKYSASQMWLYGCCCVVIIVLAIFAVVSVVYWSRIDHFHWTTVQAITDLVEQNAIQSDTKNMISFSSLAANAKKQSGHSIKNNKLGLCYTDIIKTDTDNPKAMLIPVTDQLEITGQTDNKDAFYYALDFRMTMEFDIDTSSYIINSQRLDSTQRYMTLSYLITSSYSRFSTIKLIETGLDTKTKTLIRTKEVILCSSNPSLNSKPCSSSSLVNDNSNSIFIKHSKLVVMSKLVPWLGGNYNDRNNTKLTNNTDKNTTITTTPPSTSRDDNTNNEEYDMIRGENTINTYNVEEDFTRDIRIYNVIFYKSIPSEDTSTQNGRFNAFKEIVALSIKPNKCK